jgi:hypothetical protein
MRWIFFSLLFLNIAFAGWQGFLWFGQNSRLVESETVPGQDIGVPGAVRMLDEDRGSARLKPKPSKQKKKPAVRGTSQDSFEVGDNFAAKNLDACYAFGPFGDVMESNKLTNYFEAKGIGSHLFEHKSVRKMIYLEPQSSQEAAEKLVVTLRALQIKSSLIEEGDLLNGISLGLFDNNDEIEVLTARLAALDMEVNKIEKSESYIEYWVVLQKQDSDIVDETLLNAVTNSFPRAQSSEKVCKPVAS